MEWTCWGRVMRERRALGGGRPGIRLVWALLAVLVLPAAPLQAQSLRRLPVQPWQGDAAGSAAAPGWTTCRGCDLRDRDLRGLLLIGVDLRHADLRGADLRGSNLEGADLSGANLQNARLDGARLSNADLSDADLRGADLRDAVVIQALTPGVRLDGAVLVGADITGSSLVIGGADQGPPPLPPIEGVPAPVLNQKPRR